MFFLTSCGKRSSDTMQEKRINSSEISYTNQVSEGTEELKLSVADKGRCRPEIASSNCSDSIKRNSALFKKLGLPG